MVDIEAYRNIITEVGDKVTLVAVSKTKTAEDILELYKKGHRDFGENYVQELVDKKEKLPADIRWHFIGHLQTNKARQIVPFVHLIQTVDSLKLLKEINKQSERNKKIVDCLLQVHIAQEETKFGLDEEELKELVNEVATNSNNYKWVCLKGLMAMATLTDDMSKVRNEFRYLKSIYDQLTIHDSRFTILSMGMSADYKIAIEEGSNLIRIGSLLFGERN